MKKVSTVFLCCLMAGQCIVAQTTYVGKLELNKKDKLFSLYSGKDSLKIVFDNKNLEFSSHKDFQLIKTNGSNYQLACNGDTLLINESKKQIDYSSGVSFYIATRNVHQIVLTDKDGKIVLDANYSMKGNIADFNISIVDTTFEKELLSYSTYFLYTQSVNEANFVPVHMFFMY